MTSSDQPLLIVGTGAMATLFASRLSASGQEVVLLGTWQAAIDVINREGIHLVEENGNSQHYSVRATADPADCHGIRYALLLVKSWQTQRAAAQLDKCLARDGLVLSLQNGLGNREILEDVLSENRVAVGSTTVGASLLGPGQVSLGGDGIISFSSHPPLTPMVDRLATAGFTIEQQDDIDALIWSKLLINAAINPLTAILNVPNGELLEVPAARVLSAQLASEVAAVAEARGIALAYEDPVQTVEEVARRTAGNLSSMLQDLKRNAPTEIDAICGAVVRAGEEQDIPVPRNETMWHLITALVETKSESESLSHVPAIS